MKVKRLITEVGLNVEMYGLVLLLDWESEETPCAALSVFT